MEISDLISHIDIVFQRELDNLLHGKITYSLSKEEDSFILKYQHSDTLVDIFSNIQGNPVLKKNFVDTLKNKITEERDSYYEIRGGDDIYVGATPLSFYTLLRLGFVQEAMESLQSRKVSSASLILFLESLLKESVRYFSIEDLNKILKKVKDMNIPESYSYSIIYNFRPLKSRIVSRIIEESYGLLKKQIKGINLEINQDKKNVEDKIRYLDFDERYNDLLNEIDKYINNETSDVINSGMINNLRVFMHDIIIDVAERISSNKKEEIPHIDKQSKIGDCRNYVKSNLKLSDNDNKFVNAFIDILHGEGGHTFTSNKEYFRLARNIAIEISLLILSRYEKEFPL